MGLDHTSLLPIHDTSTEIFLLTFLFCPVSQAVSLHWFIPSHNTKLKSPLSMPCDFSVLSPSHQQLAHNEAKLLSMMSLEVVLKKTSTPQPLVETHLCSQYLHTGHVATQHIGKYHFPSPCSHLSEPPILLCLNLGMASVICCTAQPSCSFLSYGNRNQE